MAINLPGLNGNSPISADLMYQFYDNKAITPQIRAALQKRQEAEEKETDKTDNPSTSSSSSKFGPAARVNITDQIIRMNINNNTTKIKKDSEEPSAEETKTKRPSRYDVLEESKKIVAQREAEIRKEKDAKLKEIADKIAADEAAKKAAEEEAKNPAEEEPAT